MFFPAKFSSVPIRLHYHAYPAELKLSPGVVQRTYQECTPINDNLSVCPSVAPLRIRAQIVGVILTIHIKSALFSIPPCA